MNTNDTEHRKFVIFVDALRLSLDGCSEKVLIIMVFVLFLYRANCW